MVPIGVGDRVRTPNSGDATVIRPNRLDPDSWIVWPDSWGRCPANTTNGPGMSLRARNLSRLEPPQPRQPPRQPNASLARTAHPTIPPRQGPTR